MAYYAPAEKLSGLLRHTLKNPARMLMKVGDLVKNIHGLYPANLGIIIKISKPQLTNPNACPYRVHWFEGYEPAWMRADWMEIFSG